MTPRGLLSYSEWLDRFRFRSTPVALACKLLGCALFAWSLIGLASLGVDLGGWAGLGALAATVFGGALFVLVLPWLTMRRLTGLVRLTSPPDETLILGFALALLAGLGAVLTLGQGLGWAVGISAVLSCWCLLSIPIARRIAHPVRITD